MYVAPAGVAYTQGTLARVGNWSRVEDALVFAIHGNDWASWVFQVSAVTPSNQTISFSRGGHQEARGAPSGHQFYVANLLEELDDPNEWYLDWRARRLYFMPNTTSSSSTPPTDFVAAQVPCLISITGTPTRPVRAVTITGLTLSYTSSTFLRDYEAPPGGDAAVHRGGAVYLEGTEGVLIHACVLTQLGGNAIVLSDYNLLCNISQNEVSWVGENGVVSIGSVELMDGVSDRRQPTQTTMDNNLVREIGVYTKQVAPFFQALSRASTVSRNVMFNVPRAAINTNDGFHGNHTIEYNVLFNCVRETGDHGPINTWDRQPYLTEARDGVGRAGLDQHWSYIHHNVLLNNYNSYYPIGQSCPRPFPPPPLHTLPHTPTSYLPTSTIHHPLLHSLPPPSRPPLSLRPRRWQLLLGGLVQLPDLRRQEELPRSAPPPPAPHAKPHPTPPQAPPNLFSPPFSPPTSFTVLSLRWCVRSFQVGPRRDLRVSRHQVRAGPRCVHRRPGAAAGPIWLGRGVGQQHLRHVRHRRGVRHLELRGHASVHAAAGRQPVLHTDGVQCDV